MEGGSKRGERSSARIERAAVELFGAHGYEGVSMRDLARRAGVTIGSINYHFGSKEALYRCFADGLVRQFVDDLSGRELRGEWFPGEIDDERTARLRRLVRIWVDLELTRDEALRRYGTEAVLRPVWRALRDSFASGGGKEKAALLGFVGSMLLGALLNDEQLENLSGISPAEARARWRVVMRQILRGEAPESAVARALAAAATACDAP